MGTALSQGRDMKKRTAQLVRWTSPYTPIIPYPHQNVNRRFQMPYFDEPGITVPKPDIPSVEEILRQVGHLYVAYHADMRGEIENELEKLMELYDQLLN